MGRFTPPSLFTLMPTDAGPSLAPASANSHPLRDATVIVSGATGAVGKALVARLVSLGARPAIAVRKPYQIEKVREQLGAAPGLVANVGSRDGEAAAGFVKGANDSLGPIRALISTAGRFAATELGREAAGDDLDLLEANFLAANNLVRAVAGHLRRRRAGNLVFCGSAAVGHGGEGMALYLASKAAMHEYARAAALELAPFGIVVALVTPRIIDTPSNRQAMPGVGHERWDSVDAVVDRLIEGAIAAPRKGVEPLLQLHVGNPAPR